MKLIKNLFYKKKKKIQKRRDLRVNIIPSFKCNFKCNMCNNWQVKDNPSLSAKEWTNIMSNLNSYSKNFKSTFISIGGGEPYLHKSVFLLMKKSKEYGFIPDISTNGFLFSDSIVKKSVESGLHGVCISLDSHIEETHDKIRGVKGSYAKILDSIEKFKTTDVVINLNTVMMKQNLSDIVPVASYAIENSIFFNLQAIVVPFQEDIKDNWFKDTKYSYLWPNDLNEVDYVIDELIKLKKGKLGEKIVNSTNQLELFRKYFYNSTDIYEHKGCHLSNLNYLTVNPDGSLFICPFDKPVGNLKNQKINYILRSDNCKKAVDKIKICTKKCHFLINCFYDEKEQNQKLSTQK